MKTDWIELGRRVLAGHRITREEGVNILRAPDGELLALLQGAYDLRRHYFGQDVQLHVIENAKSGMCEEDCAYCSQSAVAHGEIEVYDLRSGDRLLEDARKARAAGAVRYCMVTSGRGPRETELRHLCDAVRRIKGEMDIQICTSLGLLTADQASRLAEAGVNRYNHNLESSPRFYPNICTTHTWADRVETIRAAQAAGLEVCCGGLVGMGEDDTDRVDLAMAIRDLRVTSIPVNLLHPRSGTPMADRTPINPREGLKTLAMFRFVNPDREIRIAGGRESVLRSMQALALYPANSMFTEGYLTTPGQGAKKDRDMMDDAGFRVGTWGLA